MCQIIELLARAIKAELNDNPRQAHLYDLQLQDLLNSFEEKTEECDFLAEGIIPRFDGKSAEALEEAQTSDTVVLLTDVIEPGKFTDTMVDQHAFSPDPNAIQFNSTLVDQHAFSAEVPTTLDEDVFQYLEDLASADTNVVLKIPVRSFALEKP